MAYRGAKARHLAPQGSLLARKATLIYLTVAIMCEKKRCISVSDITEENTLYVLYNYLPGRTYVGGVPTCRRFSETRPRRLDHCDIRNRYS